MKRLLLLLTFLAALNSSYSQTIKNSTFESWSDAALYEDPDQYSSSNTLSIAATGEPNAIKSTGSYAGEYALKLQSLYTEEGVMPGAVYIGTPDSASNMMWGGVPFAEKPDSITGYAKFDVKEGDTAYIGVLFKKIGQPLGLCLIPFVGKQNTYKYFSAPVQWFIPVLTPDTIAVAIVSSSLFGAAVAGSEISLDHLAFTGTTLPFPNGEFENWKEYYSEEADDWLSTNLFGKPLGVTTVSKTTDSYEGNYAIMIENKPTIFIDTLAGITNGKFSVSGPVGGMPVSQIPGTLSGYYKYSGEDYAFADIRLYKYNEELNESQLLAEEIMNFEPADQFTNFRFSVEYDDDPKPDTVTISFVVSNSPWVKEGGVLILDSLNLTFKTNGIDDLTNSKVRVFPNPATDNLFFEFSEGYTGKVMVSIFNANGLEVKKSGISCDDGRTGKIDISGLIPGIYFYKIQDDEKILTGKVIVK